MTGTTNALDAHDYGKNARGDDEAVAVVDDVEGGDRVTTEGTASRVVTFQTRSTTATATADGGESDGEEDVGTSAAASKFLYATKSFRAPKSGDKRSLDVYVSTWNVGNKAPTSEAASGWLKSARGSDVIAIGAQEASYVKTKKTTKPSAVSAACGDAAPYASRFKRGFLHSTKWTRLGMMMGGAMAGGVMGYVPGAMCGMFTGWYTSKRLVQEIKVRMHWFDFLSAAVGAEYVLLQSEMLLQMRLAVFVKQRLVSRIQSVKVGSKATGLGNLVGNKGGIVVHIELDNGETIAFVSCHLAAHEQPKFLQARNDMVLEIFNGAWGDCQLRPACALPVVKDINATFFDTGNEVLRKFKGAVTKTSNAFETATGAKIGSGYAPRRNQVPELLDSTSHVFFFGDLNYRLDPGQVVGDEWDTHWNKKSESESKPTREKYDVESVPLSKFPADRPSATPGAGEDDSDNENEIVDASPFQIGRAAIIESVGQQRFTELSKADQLKRSIREGKVLSNFREMPLSFFPTFKRASNKSEKSKGLCSAQATTAQESSYAQPGTSEYYNAKRVPSWCDRVLVHSLAGAKSSIDEIEYGARHDVLTSDHAPVYARFRVHLRSLPHVKSLPRATLKLTTLQVTRTYTEEEIGNNVGSSVYVHLFVPHTRIVLPVAREVSSTHIARDGNQPNETGIYDFPPQNLPSTLVGYDASDEQVRIAQAKSQARFALLTEDERKKIKTASVTERDSDSEARAERLGMDAFKEFVGIISVVDSRTGQKLGTCAVPLPTSSASFSVPLLYFSKKVGSITGSWSLST